MTQQHNQSITIQLPRPITQKETAKIQLEIANNIQHIFSIEKHETKTEKADLYVLLELLIALFSYSGEDKIELNIKSKYCDSTYVDGLKSGLLMGIIS